MLQQLERATGTSVSERRAYNAELLCDHYRQAFLHMLKEGFTDLDSTLQRMLEVLSTTLDVDRVSLWIFDDDGAAIRCAREFHRVTGDASQPSVLLRRDFPKYFTAISQQLVIAANDAKHDDRTEELSALYLLPLGIESMLDVPVRAFGRYIGILCHENTAGQRQWSLEDQNFASGVATQVALAYERDFAKRAQENLLQRSLHDPETSLSNCVHFDNALDNCLRSAESGTAVIVAAVDQYNYILGALGAQRMQQLLQKFAERLVAVSPPGAVVARIAANEFAVLVRDITREQLSAVVQSWTSAIKAPLVSGEQKIFLTLSAGYAYRDPTGNSTPSTAEAVRGEAHLAQLDAKRDGGDRSKSFAGEMRQRLLSRAGVEQDLRRALDAREFALHFQPIVHLATGRCVSVEALLRWQHPVRGVVMPSEFMPVALDSGVMLELGRRVLRAACESIVQLRKRIGNETLMFSLNMSAPEILLPGTVDAIKEELRRAQLSPEALTIEITESALIVDLDRASESLREIRASGIKVALDDFGTAFSSLTWLRQLPIDTIKIDRSFVAGVTFDRRDLAIVKSIVGLASALKQTVVAEGIETAEQLKLLRELGLEYGQGFLFAAAEPIEKFIDDRRMNDRFARICRE